MPEVQEDRLEVLNTTGGPLSTIEALHRQRITLAFSTLGLAEVQLLLLGLWVIGEENRIDPRLNTEYGWLVNGLNQHAQESIGNILSDQAPSPHPQPAKRPRSR